VPPSIGYYTAKDFEPKQEETNEDTNKKLLKILNQTKIERLSKEITKENKELRAEW